MVPDDLLDMTYPKIGMFLLAVPLMASFPPVIFYAPLQGFLIKAYTTLAETKY